MTYSGGTEPSAEGQNYPAYLPQSGTDSGPDPFAPPASYRETYAAPTDSRPPPADYPVPYGADYPVPYGADYPVPYDTGLVPPGYPAAYGGAVTGYPPPAGSPGYPPPAGYAYPPPAYGYATVAPPRNGLGTAALVLGILGLVLCWNIFGVVLNILAVIFGGVGGSRAKKGLASNRGMALAGLILGMVGLALLVLLVIVGISFMATGFR